MTDVKTLAEAVRPYLTEKRYAHTLRCRDMAVRLSDRWGCDRDTASKAALLHDITKKLTDDEQLKLCEKYGIINKYTKDEFGILIHADTGAEVARHEFGADEDIYRAIKLHTLGDKNMTLLQKIIYLADAVEEGRDYPGVEEIRAMAFEDIDRAMLMSLEGTVRNVRERGGEPNRQSVEAAEYIRAAIKEKEKIMEPKNLEPKELLAEIVKIADSRKARDIVAIEVAEKTTLTDYYVIMTGTSSTHTRAISEEIEFQLKEKFGIFGNVEGITSNWILLDYDSVVVSIFLSESREMYALERMWGDGTPVDLSAYITE